MPTINEAAIVTSLLSPTGFCAKTKNWLSGEKSRPCTTKVGSTRLTTLKDSLELEEEGSKICKINLRQHKPWVYGQKH